MDINQIAAGIDWIAVRLIAIKAIEILVILIATWLIAKAVKWAFAKLVDRIPLLRRHAGGGESVGLSLGKIVGLLVWLLGLIAILQRLGLDNVLNPLQLLVDQLFHYVPNIVGGAIIFFIGTIVAKIASQLLETTLIAANVDGWAARSGLVPAAMTSDATLTAATATKMVAKPLGISKMLSILLYAVVMILFAIAALQALGISSISIPAVNMLQTVFDAIPRFILAAILLGIGFVIGKFVKRLIEQVMPSLGVDASLASMGILPAGTSASEIIGTIAMTAIMLLVGIQALQALQFAPLTLILVQVVELGGRVLFGSVIIAAAVMLAQIISKLMTSSTGTRGFAPTIVRYAIVALGVAMGLRFMGLANEIVNLAFGLILGSAAVACALAFGIGGQTTASKVLERMRERADTGLPL